MLQVARLAPTLLGESSALVDDFVRSLIHEDGGFRDREGKADLYYTVFGIECLQALQAEVPVDRIVGFLDSFSDGDGLDLVHLACLARCLAALSGVEASPDRTRALLAHAERFRTPDGGFRNEPGARTGTAYGCFIALGLYQDIGVELPQVDRVTRFLETMATPDGAYANEASMTMGTTPTTAAAVTFLRNLGAAQRPESADWLEARCQAEGGFLAMPQAPMPDLLSTATAIHALAGLQRPLDAIKEPCLNFIDTLWTNRGGFYGNWADNDLDCEYTYYGLLALGHLSL